MYFKKYKNFLNEGFMSEIDIIRQESKTLQEFLKRVFQEYPPMKGEEDFLKDMWETGEQYDDEL
jgi:hypothetical protein